MSTVIEAYSSPTAFTIKTWAEDDRPREKLQLKGKHTLSDAELLAILLGSGTRRESAVALAQRLLHSVHNNLDELGKLSLERLMTFKGIGAAKAVTIVAATELGRRRQLAAPVERPQISSSHAAYEQIAPLLQDLPHEEFWMILLNRANRLLAKVHLSTGGVAGTVIDSKLVFKAALAQLASGIILVHNHPSGNRQPSEADRKITTQLQQAGRVLEIPILDHLIIAGKSYYSFADEGLL